MAKIPCTVFRLRSGVTEALANIRAIVSFGPFIDDSAAYADVDSSRSPHSRIGNGGCAACLGGPPIAFAVATPFVQPLYDTRALEQTLGDIAQKLNVAFEPVRQKTLSSRSCRPVRRGTTLRARAGFGRDNEARIQPVSCAAKNWNGAIPFLPGRPSNFPLQFQPYLSLQYHDGRGANLPWMQELPDPASSSMWDLPAGNRSPHGSKLNVTTGDWVRVESRKRKSGSAGLCASCGASWRRQYGDWRRAHALRTIRIRPGS